MSSSLFNPPPLGIYAFTEVLTFIFPGDIYPSTLTDDATPAGRVWATTLKTYLGLEQTGLVWWACVHDAPHKAILLIDWKAAEGRDTFKASAEADNLSRVWHALPTTTGTSAVYHFPHHAGAREAALSKGFETTNVLFTFTFSQPLSIDGVLARRWDALMAEFALAVLSSPGGVAATACIFGWERGRESYCAAFRYISIQKMQSFLNDGEGARLFGELQSQVLRDVRVEYLEARTYKEGWHGHVDKTRADNPGLAAFIADAQRRLRGMS